MPVDDKEFLKLAAAIEYFERTVVRTVEHTNALKDAVENLEGMDPITTPQSQYQLMLCMMATLSPEERRQLMEDIAGTLGPTPPRFATVAEADAWLEANGG